MRALVIGGFEPSGHDSVGQAIREAGEARRHKIEQWDWRDVIACDEHPVFHLHRLGVNASEPELAAIMDDSRIVEGLAADLGALLPLDEYEGIVSVHPWSTAIAVETARRLPAGRRPVIVDCHGEFTPFPLGIVVSSLVSAYVGGVFCFPQRPSVRRRTFPTGVPVRAPFQGPSPSPLEGRTGLTVNAGHGLWAISSVKNYVAPLIEGLKPDAVYVIGEHSASAAGDLQEGVVEVRYVSGPDEIAAALRASSYVLTKGSGSALAEGLAVGCIPLCVESGVFWEDEARAWLSSVDASIPFELQTVGQLAWRNAAPAGMDQLGEQCRSAANDIWRILERRRVADDENTRQKSETTINELLKRVRQDELLPNTDAALIAALEGWQ